MTGEVSLLTGDIKIRAPPGTRNELIICTSEILRNKLVKASGLAQGMDPSKLAPDGGGQLQGPDPDLERLGCVVSDEVHYINDPERGSVWEETMMHLPHEVCIYMFLHRCVYVYNMCVCVCVCVCVCARVCVCIGAARGSERNAAAARGFRELDQLGAPAPGRDCDTQGPSRPPHLRRLHVH